MGKVTVRVWLMKTGESKVGHASLETHGENGKYISFWPSEPAKANNFFSPTASGSHHTLAKDIHYERRNADLLIELYGLDVEKINEAYSEFEASECDWALWGSSVFRSENARNCSGLVHFLLRKGGIDSIVSKYFKLEKVASTGIKAATNGAKAYGAGYAASYFASKVLFDLMVMTIVPTPLTTGAFLLKHAAPAVMFYFAGEAASSAIDATTSTVESIKLSAGAVKSTLLTTPDDIAELAKLALLAEKKLGLRPENSKPPVLS